ncbi:MAG: hypothetical protein V1913_09645 [Fibrobacterota bacterium]
MLLETLFINEHHCERFFCMQIQEQTRRAESRFFEALASGRHWSGAMEEGMMEIGPVL